jgi:hypothetical protein
VEYVSGMENHPEIRPGFWCTDGRRLTLRLSTNLHPSTSDRAGLNEFGFFVDSIKANLDRWFGRIVTQVISSELFLTYEG